MIRTFFLGSLLCLLAGVMGCRTPKALSTDATALTPVSIESPVSTLAQEPATLTPIPTTPPSPAPITTPCPYAPDDLMSSLEIPLRIAYLKQGDIWLWASQTDTTTKLTAVGNVVNMLLSPDKQQIAFATGPWRIEPQELWVVSIEGNNERRLLSETDLLSFRQNPEHEYVRLHEFFWMPSGGQIAFSTKGERSHISEYFSYDDLHLLNIGTAQHAVLLAPGTGREIRLSPDGTQIAIGTESGISLWGVDGTNRRDFPFDYEDWGVGNYIFRPIPVWTADSAFVLTIIPTAGSPDGIRGNSNLTVWRISAKVDGFQLPPQVIPPANFSGFIWSQFSPNLRYLTVRRYTEVMNINEIYVVDLERGQQVVSIQGDSANPVQWHPDSFHFVYDIWSEEDERHNTSLLDICGNQSLIPSPLTWVDNERYVFAEQMSSEHVSVSNWELWLGQPGKEAILIDSFQDVSHWDSPILVITW